MKSQVTYWSNYDLLPARHENSERLSAHGESIEMRIREVISRVWTRDWISFETKWKRVGMSTAGRCENYRRLGDTKQ